MKIMKELNIDALIGAIKLCEEREEKNISSVISNKNRGSVGAVLCFISHLPEYRGIYEYFVNGNKFSLKQEFYLRSKLVLASVGHAGGASFEVSIDFLFALLSDNIETIKEMARLETSELISQRDDPRSSRFQVYMLQQAILGNDEKLSVLINKFVKGGGSKIREEYERGENFFYLLLNGDKSALESLIENKHSKIKSSLPIISDYMAVTATIEAKLCWFRGIDVHIKNPRVPMDLMPIEPLEVYDDVYNFLRHGWTQPKFSIIDRMRRFF